MHRQLLSGTATLAVAALLALSLAAPAAARIECRGNFQMSKYGLIATPYCEEENIARVARSYGSKVTGAEVRNNPQEGLSLPGLWRRYAPEGRLRGLFSRSVRPLEATHEVLPLCDGAAC